MDKKFKFVFANHVIALALGVLMLTFCASNYITGGENISGMSLIACPNGDLIASTLSFGIVFMITALFILVIVCASLILSDFEIIEDKKIIDMLVKLLLCLSIFLLIISFMILICLKLKTSQLNRGTGQNVLGVGGVINFVFSLILLSQSIALKYVDKIDFDRFD